MVNKDIKGCSINSKPSPLGSEKRRLAAFTRARNKVSGTAFKRYRARAEVVKAMAHPTRLFIIDVLRRGKRCVCELRKMIGDDMSTVSKHLSVLKNASIVTDEKLGKMVFYSLSMCCSLEFMDCIDKQLKQRSKTHFADVA